MIHRRQFRCAGHFGHAGERAEARLERLEQRKHSSGHCHQRSIAFRDLASALFKFKAGENEFNVKHRAYRKKLNINGYAPGDGEHHPCPFNLTIRRTCLRLSERIPMLSTLRERGTFFMCVGVREGRTVASSNAIQVSSSGIHNVAPCQTKTDRWCTKCNMLENLPHASPRAPLREHTHVIQLIAKRKFRSIVPRTVLPILFWRFHGPRRGMCKTGM